MPVRWLDGMPKGAGVRDLVIAWTLGAISLDGDGSPIQYRVGYTREMCQPAPVGR